ncbi:MAG: DUF1801 domain-containing protein [Planctomycetota bacterium]|nr:MAG: DUF1801 domain-containing protein [Planctomycetota bacterium]
MQRKLDSPEAYRKAVPEHQKELFEKVRAAIFEAVPEIEEINEFGMLGYPGLANLAAQKHHVSLYVLPEILAKHKDRFPGTSCGKSCLRFKKADQADSEKLVKLLKEVRKTRLARE